jgi:hypothetical protein
MMWKGYSSQVFHDGKGVLAQCTLFGEGVQYAMTKQTPLQNQP